MNFQRKYLTSSFFTWNAKKFFVISQNVPQSLYFEKCSLVSRIPRIPAFCNSDLNVSLTQIGGPMCNVCCEKLLHACYIHLLEHVLDSPTLNKLQSIVPRFTSVVCTYFLYYIFVCLTHKFILSFYWYQIYFWCTRFKLFCNQ